MEESSIADSSQGRAEQSRSHTESKSSPHHRASSLLLQPFLTMTRCRPSVIVPATNPRREPIALSSMHLTAIVPATDTPATLSRCVNAIRRAVEPPDEVRVIDDP